MSKVVFSNAHTPQLPWVIAGPCMAESQGLCDEVASFVRGLADELGFTYIFKASFDKANRTSVTSDRGPGMEQTAKWFSDIAAKYHCATLTDVHECVHVKRASEFADVLQIPAFLCRQTDLIVAAVASGCAVNVKKGQFLSPAVGDSIVKKAVVTAREHGLEPNIALTERGTMFGYGDLIVDMRGFARMAASGAPVIFDITHSTQRTATGGANETVSGGQREYAGLLARAAAATGYLSGFFIEVHPDPSKAKSDAAIQLNFAQAETLLRQILPLWKNASGYGGQDRIFQDAAKG